MTLTKSSQPTPPTQNVTAINSPDAGHPKSETSITADSALDAPQWESLRKRVNSRRSTKSAVHVFGPDAVDGQIYLWGLSTALDAEIPALAITLAGLAATSDKKTLAAYASGKKPKAASHPAAKWFSSETLINEASIFVEASQDGRCDWAHAYAAITWAAALPSLTGILSQEQWWSLLNELLRRRAESTEKAEPTQPQHLLLAGELGLTVAWRLKDLPSCERIAKASATAVSEYLQGSGDTIDTLLRQPNTLRLVLASLLRSETLLQVAAKRKLRKKHQDIVDEIATWVAAMTRHDGTPAFSNLNSSDVRFDVGSRRAGTKPSKQPAKKKAKSGKATSNSKSKRGRTPSTPEGELYGLMKAATRYDPDALVPAFAASLGQSHSGGRLAWEVNLPESMWHSDEAGIAALLPEWDVRRGRTFIDYSGEDMRLEIMGGRTSVVQGVYQTMIEVDGVSQHPTGPWSYTCEYTDDDVHYLELEQAYSGGVVLQRQFVVIRDDRCVLVADAILPGEQAPVDAKLRCVSRLPLAAGIQTRDEAETREIILSDKKRRAMVLPLAASEWRVGPTNCTMEASEDGHLVITSSGTGSLYSPVWLDFQARRFNRKRTWRQLTVADELQILPRNVAAAFRVQVGSEHWAVYRSLQGRRPRSFMGKHIVADFFTARFHPGDGGMEELVTVDDEDES